LATLTKVLHGFAWSLPENLRVVHKHIKHHSQIPLILLFDAV